MKTIYNDVPIMVTLVPGDVWVVAYFDVRQDVRLMAGDEDADGVSSAAQLQQPNVETARQHVTAEMSMNDHVVRAVEQRPWSIGHRRLSTDGRRVDDGRRRLGAAARLCLLERHPADVRRVECLGVVQRPHADEQSGSRRVVDDRRVMKLSEVVDAERRLNTHRHMYITNVQLRLLLVRLRASAEGCTELG